MSSPKNNTEGHYVGGKTSGELSDCVLWGLRVAAIVAIAYSIFMLSERHYAVGFLGNISPWTLALVSSLYVIGETSLTQSGMGKLDAVVAALVLAYAYTQTFELLFHFTFPIYLNYFKPISLTGIQFRYILVTTAPIAPIILFRKYLSFKWTSGILLGAFAVIWLVWILCGYPQCTGDLFYYPRIIVVTNACDTSVLLTASSKTTLAAFYGSLLNYGVVFFLVRNRVFGRKVSA